MANTESVRPASLQILVIDDSRTVRTKICYWLRRRFPGCTCVEAASGEEALALLKVEEPAVVLVDVVLPGMSGFQTTQEIKALAPDIPIFVISVDESYSYTVSAKAAGANAFVTKSAIAEQLFPLLDEILQSRS
jgi:two-component system, NarL family, invasion response regulator UvrY